MQKSKTKNLQVVFESLMTPDEETEHAGQGKEKEKQEALVKWF